MRLPVARVRAVLNSMLNIAVLFSRGPVLMMPPTRGARRREDGNVVPPPRHNIVRGDRVAVVHQGGSAHHQCITASASPAATRRGNDQRAARRSHPARRTDRDPRRTPLRRLRTTVPARIGTWRTCRTPRHQEQRQQHPTSIGVPVAGHEAASSHRAAAAALACSRRCSGVWLAARALPALHARWLAATRSPFRSGCWWDSSISPVAIFMTWTAHAPISAGRARARMAHRGARVNFQSEALPPTRSLATTPTLYHVNVIPTTPFLVVPEVSSERREYVATGRLGPPVVPSNLVRILEGATKPIFALLTSAMARLTDSQARRPIGIEARTLQTSFEVRCDAVRIAGYRMGSKIGSWHISY